jgi:hypothetical protein
MQGELWVAEPTRPRLEFSLGEALDDGLRAMRRSGVVLSVAQLVAALPGAGVALAFRAARGQPHFASRAYWEQTILVTACGTVLGAFFRGGLARMSLDACRGAPVRLGDLARGMRFFPAMLVLEVVHLVVLALSVPLLAVPYVLVWAPLALAPFALVDRDDGLVDAVRFAWASARGERLHLFGFLLATAIVSYLGLVACCVGELPAAALVGVATAHVYARFNGEARRGDDQ